MADSFVRDEDRPFDRMNIAAQILGLPDHMREELIERWKIHGYAPLRQFTPCAAHVVTVQLFFQIALAAGHIGTERTSNQIDVAYLYYLPFCSVFVSSDKLH